MKKLSTSRGFTLLEVMVSVAILGLGLTAILSAQTGSFSASAHARNISIATGLVRCKMTELEERLQRDGFTELDEVDSGVCCDGDETPNVTCTWRIEKPTMPEPKFGELDLDTDVGSSDLGSLGTLAQGATDGGMAGVAQMLAGSPTTPGAEGLDGGAGSSPMDGITSMVMSMVYPDLRSLFEASTRRVTVTLTWTEGKKEHSLEVMQWFTIPQQNTAELENQQASELIEAAESATSPSGTGTGTTKTPPPRKP